jgi:hypothetical protein
MLKILNVINVINVMNINRILFELILIAISIQNK